MDCGLPPPSTAPTTPSARKTDSRCRPLRFQFAERFDDRRRGRSFKALWRAFQTRISTAAEQPLRKPDVEQCLHPARDSVDYRLHLQRRASNASRRSDVDHDRVAELAALPDDTPVDIIVVDRDWSKDIWRNATDPEHSSPEKTVAPASESADSVIASEDATTFWYRVWSSFYHFFVFFSAFDEETEHAYQVESWNTNKVWKNYRTPVAQPLSPLTSSLLSSPVSSSLSTGR